MAVSTSLGIGATGVNTFQSALTVVSNNIANTDTVAFKENDISFAELVSRGIGKGKFQIGDGASVNSVQNRFSQGKLDLTRTSDLDLAIDGEGFFVVQDPFGSTIPLFTRAGVFHENKDGFVVNPDGFLLQGSAITVDPVTGTKTLGKVDSIDLSLKTAPPKATTKANFAINLFSQTPDPNTVVTGTEPTNFDSLDNGLIINGFSVGQVTGNDAEERITSLIEQINVATSETGVIASNTTPTSIRLTHVNGGAIQVTLDTDIDPDIAAKTGLQSGTFLAEGSKSLTGVVTTTAGSRTVKGQGTRFSNELIAGDAIVIGNVRYTVESVQSDTALTLATAGVDPGVESAEAVSQPAAFSTPISFFDSLGTERLVNVRFRKTAENEWEWNAIVDKKDNQNGLFDQVQATGHLSFGANGQLDPSKTLTTTFPTDGFDFKGILPSTAPATPAPGGAPAAPADPTPNQKIAFNFTGTTQYAVQSGSAVLNQTQDGFSSGFLQSKSVDSEGVINGLFTNGTIQPLYQLVVALFPNQDGLTRVGGNLYTQSDISGVQIQAAAGSGGRGKIASRAIELSTVDLAVQFVKLITYQRGFQANSRVITTSDEVVQELVNLKR